MSKWAPLIPLAFAILFLQLGWGIMTLLALMVMAQMIKEARDQPEQKESD